MFFITLLFILIGAGIGRWLAGRFNQPAILGELVFGLILGNLPGGFFATMEVTEPISYLADLGVILLLFSAGLSTDLNRFKQLGKVSFAIAIVEVTVSLGAGYSLSLLFGLSSQTALFIGGAMVATSIGVGAEILSELKLLGKKVGTLIISIAAIDDIMGIILLAAIGTGLSSGSVIRHEITVIGASIGFFLISLTLMVKFSRFLFEKFPINKPEATLILGLIVALSFSIIASKIGLSMLIGAFLAGLVIGQTSLARKLLEKVFLFGESFFVPIFFVTLGMKFDFQAFAGVGFFAVILVVVGIIAKFSSCSLGARLFGFTGKESLVVGTTMVPRAEVTLIIVSLGIEYGIITSGLASAVLFLVIITTLVTPLALNKMVKFEGKLS